MKRFTLLALGIALACLIAISCGEKKEAAKTDAGTTTDQSTPAQTNDTASATGTANMQAPGTVHFAAYDTEGALRQSTEWVTKKPVIINFWGTWCPPCRREIPDLVKLYGEYKNKGVEIVSLAVNDNPATVKTFTAKAGMNWVMLMGTDDIYEKYGGIRGVPTTIFLDRNGKEVQRFVGATSYDTFKGAADKIL